MGDDVHERERRFPKKRPAKAEILAAGWPEGDGGLLGGWDNDDAADKGPEARKRSIQAEIPVE